MPLRFIDDFSLCSLQVKMPRARFALVLTKDPPAVDVFKDTEFADRGNFAVGEKRRVKQKSWAETDGEILSIGIRCDFCLFGL